jgi:hypothetical protein
MNIPNPTLQTVAKQRFMYHRVNGQPRRLARLRTLHDMKVAIRKMHNRRFNKQWPR